MNILLKVSANKPLTVIKLAAFCMVLFLFLQVYKKPL